MRVRVVMAEHAPAETRRWQRPSWASVAVACSVIVWPTAKRCAAVGESIVTCGAVLPGSIRADATGDVAPPLSRTVSVLVNEPAAVYVCVVVGAVVVTVDDPSPKFQVYVRVSPASGSELALPSKLTASGTPPDVGVAVILAVGGRLGTTVGSIRRTSPPFE